MPIFRPVARREFDEAADWYDQQRPGRGAKFTGAVREVLTRIADEPELYAQVYEDVREALVSGYPYCLLSGRSGPGDWLSRISHGARSFSLAKPSKKIRVGQS